MPTMSASDLGDCPGTISSMARRSARHSPWCCLASLGRAAERSAMLRRAKASARLSRRARRSPRCVRSGLFGTVGEAGLLHYRGAFQNPAMVLPVALPPVAAVLVGVEAIKPSNGRLARIWLKLTAALGFVGSRLPYFRRPSRQWRLAQLEPERSERTANSGPAKFHRPRACWARCALADGGGSR